MNPWPLTGPMSCSEGVAYFKEQALRWRSHIERLDEEGLARPVGEPEHAPVASLAWEAKRMAESVDVWRTPLS
jgi:hypothetical protein